MGLFSSAAFINIYFANRTLTMSVYPDNSRWLVTPIANAKKIIIHNYVLRYIFDSNIWNENELLFREKIFLSALDFIK